MGKFEYQHVQSIEYLSYMDKANVLLSEIAQYKHKLKTSINYLDIISYFEENYNILIAFMDNPRKKIYLNQEPSNKFIKYPELSNNSKFIFQDKKILDKISGVTIPGNANRPVIMINQTCSFPRIVFTILHELVHTYFHVQGSNSGAFASLILEKYEGKYSSKTLHIENEANIVASILFCSKEKIEQMFLKNYSFEDMIVETGMSAPALHNRLLNYFDHVLSYKSLALGTVLSFRNDTLNKKKITKIKRKMIELSLKDLKWTRKITLENGKMLGQADCIDHLCNELPDELLSEIGYAHSTNQTRLELLASLILNKLRF